MRFQPSTHCKRGHEFTPENTQWVNVTSPGGTTRRGRLCRICSRARVKRYLDKHPRKAPKRLTDLPLHDFEEFDLERYIRRVLRSRVHQRAPEFWSEVESRLPHRGFQVKCEPHRVPLRHLSLTGESWAKYAKRTDASWEDHGDWFVSRMLDDPRIRVMLRKARSRYIVIDPADIERKNPKPRARQPRRQRGPSLTAVPPAVGCVEAGVG
jgi:hypothetical protein